MTDKYKEAYLEFIDKTDWVRAKIKELGKHRADILRERIEALQEENAELKSRIASLESLTYMISRFKDSPPLPLSGFDPISLMDKQE